MRRKSETVLTFAWNNDRLPKSVLDRREKYKGISRVLDGPCLQHQRYHVTNKGRDITTALCRSRHITLQRLAQGTPEGSHA